jgi:hypothetical protein
MTSTKHNLNTGEIFARSKAVFAGHTVPLTVESPVNATFFACFPTIFRPRTNFFPWHTPC